jgi:hypothetical protein
MLVMVLGTGNRSVIVPPTRDVHAPRGHCVRERLFVLETTTGPIRMIACGMSLGNTSLATPVTMWPSGRRHGRVAISTRSGATNGWRNQ